MSSLGAICRNCSFNFCSVSEFLVSSAMYCFELIMTESRIRFKVCARAVPRCGVARKVIAVMALMIDSYSGSFCPWIYACLLLAQVFLNLFFSSLASLTTRPPMLWATKIMGTFPMSRSSISGSLPYFRSNNRSFAKSSIDNDTFPAFWKDALYPNVNILARQRSCSKGRKVSGQNSSEFLCFDHVHLLVPPSP